jgi:hypothetical protein
MTEPLLTRLHALPLWAFTAANDIIQRVEPDGAMTYRLPSGLKLRLTAEIGEALVRARAVTP